VATNQPAPDDGLPAFARVLDAIMTERRIRHMPVVVKGELTGIVSIGDIVKRRVDELESEREALSRYITSGTT
jgi:CBS domain-containing protein